LSRASPPFQGFDPIEQVCENLPDNMGLCVYPTDGMTAEKSSEAAKIATRGRKVIVLPEGKMSETRSDSGVVRLWTGC
jgi:hypothetical protein